MFLIKVISSGALKEISDELNHDLHRHHHGSEVEDKEDNFPLLNNSREHEIDGKSKYD